MMERKDNRVMEKVDNLRDDFNVEEQLKDLCGNLRIVERSIGFILDPDFDIYRLEKFLIVFKLFNLGVKIPENAFYIIIKNGIYVYSKDLQEVCIFQKIYERYPKVWEN